MPGKSLLKSAPLLYKDHAIDAVISGYHAAFIVAVVFSAIGLFVAFFLKDKEKEPVVLTSKGGAK
jgi:hypothetical protein